mgnify:FL=1
MKWFDEWFYRKSKWAWNRDRDEAKVPSPVGLATAEEDLHRLNDGISFHIKTVIGGRLVTVRSYDNRTDRSDHRTYVITDEQEFDHELGKIITLESMRR